jgi:hypothetical protein
VAINEDYDRVLELFPPLHEHLAARGEGPYAVAFAAAQGVAAQTLD